MIWNYAFGIMTAMAKYKKIKLQHTTILQYRCTLYSTHFTVQSLQNCSLCVPCMTFKTGFLVRSHSEYIITIQALHNTGHLLREQKDLQTQKINFQVRLPYQILYICPVVDLPPYQLEIEWSRAFLFVCADFFVPMKNGPIFQILNNRTLINVSYHVQ